MYASKSRRVWKPYTWLVSMTTLAEVSADDFFELDFEESLSDDEEDDAAAEGAAEDDANLCGDGGEHDALEPAEKKQKLSSDVASLDELLPQEEALPKASNMHAAPAEVNANPEDVEELAKVCVHFMIGLCAFYDSCT